MLGVFKQIHGSRSSHSLCASRCLAATLYKQARYEEATELQSTTLQLYAETYGPKHAHILLSMGNEASILWKQALE